MRYTKAFIFVILIAVITLPILSCNNNSSSNEQNNSQLGSSAQQESSPDKLESQIDNADLAKIQMTTENEEYSGDTKEIKVIISNQSDNEYSYEAYIFTLQKKASDNWIDVAFKGGDAIFPALAGVLKPSESAEIFIDLAQYFNLPLEAGQYRIKKDRLFAEFKIM